MQRCVFFIFSFSSPSSILINKKTHKSSSVGAVEEWMRPHIAQSLFILLPNGSFIQLCRLTDKTRWCRAHQCSLHAQTSAVRGTEIHLTWVNADFKIPTVFVYRRSYHHGLGVSMGICSVAGDGEEDGAPSFICWGGWGLSMVEPSFHH